MQLAFSMQLKQASSVGTVAGAAGAGCGRCHPGQSQHGRVCAVARRERGLHVRRRAQPLRLGPHHGRRVRMHPWCSLFRPSSAALNEAMGGGPQGTAHEADRPKDSTHAVRRHMRTGCSHHDSMHAFVCWCMASVRRLQRRLQRGCVCQSGGCGAGHRHRQLHPRPCRALRRGRPAPFAGPHLQVARA